MAWTAVCSKAVVLLVIVAPIVWFCVCSMFIVYYVLFFLVLQSPWCGKERWPFFSFNKNDRIGLWDTIKGMSKVKAKEKDLRFNKSLFFLSIENLRFWK